MDKTINLRNALGTHVLRAADAVLGESREALELTQGDQAPVIYFPRTDIAMAFLERSATTSECAIKGTASYYSIVTPAGVIADAAWSYEDPNSPHAAIAGHLAFYPEKVTIERV